MVPRRSYSLLGAVLTAVLAAAARGAAAAPLSRVADATADLFPVPQSVVVGDPSADVPVAPSFTITPENGPTTSDVLIAAIKRYSALIPTSRGDAESSAASTTALTALIVRVADPSVTAPNLDVDASYTLTVPSAGGDTATLTAATPFGALYGLDTFAQLVSSAGVVAGAEITIKDAPSFRHRGLTIDVGRRFAPVALVESILDGLAYSKMNVLHMSLSGPTVRVEMPDAFPELTAWMQDTQYYTQDQIKGIVEYARLRGVMVIPEIDIPAHASGFFPLAETSGLQFCDADRTTLSDDPTTIALVLRVFDEIVKLFPSPVIHIGGDEALPKGGCTFHSIHQVEIAVQQHLIKQHGRTPMGWNEVYSSPKETAPNGAIAGHTILQNWKGTGDADTVGAGFASVDSEYLKLYLNEQCCRVNPSSADGPTARFKQCFYVDPARGLTAAQRAKPDVLHLLQGAEAAMWSDEYCPSPLCAISGTYGWMADPEYDAVYVESFGKQVFPKTAATGAGLWNFLDDTVLPGAELARRLDVHNGRLAARKVVTCPTGCNCDWGQSCGKPYAGRATKPKLKAKLVNKTPFPVKVRAIKPCNRTNFGNLAVLQPGQSYVATDDFETEATVKGNDPPILTGDPFDLWVGDSTWMDIQAEFHITYDASKYGNDYMAYTQIGSSAAPTDGMHVGIESAMSTGVALYVKEYGMGPGRGISALSLSQTLCRLRVNHSSCLIRGTGDWIAETIDLETGKVVAQSDPFSKWYGSGYAGANVTLVVAQDAKNSGYLDMTPKDFGRGRNGGGISEPKPTYLRGAEIASFS